MDVTLEQLLEAGAHFGHQARRWNPKMAPYIYAVNDDTHVFDLAQTREAVLGACEAMQKVVAAGGMILFVGTKRQAKDLVREAAEKVSMPYLVERWPGGVLTNFEQVHKSVKKLDEMKKARASGGYDEYTKKERILVDREVSRLEKIFGGIAGLKKLPDMLFVVDTHEESTAVREAKRVGVPVIGIVDTNADPEVVNYPIPANDDAVRSIALIVGVITEAVEEGLKERGKATSDK